MPTPAPKPERRIGIYYLFVMPTVVTIWSQSVLSNHPWGLLGKILETVAFLAIYSALLWPVIQGKIK